MGKVERSISNDQLVFWSRCRLFVTSTRNIDTPSKLTKNRCVALQKSEETTHAQRYKIIEEKLSFKMKDLLRDVVRAFFEGYWGLFWNEKKRVYWGFSPFWILKIESTPVLFLFFLHFIYLNLYFYIDFWKGIPFLSILYLESSVSTLNSCKVLSTFTLVPKREKKIRKWINNQN